MPPEREPEPTIESLFQRWRAEDDSEALAEVLARTEGELLTLARRQARDESAAWDLVQETWYAVLREASRWDDEQRLMPWLVGILQIEVRRARRESARIPDPSRVEIGVGQPADQAAPEAELRTYVAAGIAQVPVLYRDVLEMHLFDDLTPTEIAARTGRAPGTVRVQVFRGLAQLRKLVPGSLSLGVALAVLAPRSEAARWLPLIERAASGGGGIGPIEPSRTESAQPAATKPATSTATTWLASESARWIGTGLALVLAVGIGSILVRDDERVTSTGVTPAAAQATRATNTEELVASAAQQKRVALVERSGRDIASPPAPGVWIVARVEGSSALPPAEPTVTVRAADARVPALVVRLAAADSFAIDVTDWYRVGGPAPAEFIANYDHPSALPRRAAVLLDAQEVERARDAARDGTRRAIAIEFALVPPAARVHGRVLVDPEVRSSYRDARLVAGLFELDERGVPSDEPVEGVHVRTDGTFSLRSARIGRHVVVCAAEQGATPAHSVVDLVAGDDKDVGARTLALGATIAGRIEIDPSVHAAQLEPVLQWRPRHEFARRSVFGVSLGWVDGRFELVTGDVRVEDDGRFRVAGLGQAEYELEVAYDSADAPALDLGDPSAREVAIVRAPNASVSLAGRGAAARVVVRSANEPVAGAEVRVIDAQTPPVRTDARGEVVLYGELADEVRRVLVTRAGFDPLEIVVDSARLAMPSEIAVELTPTLAGAELVLEAAGVNWAGARVVLVPTEALNADALVGLRRGEVPQSIPGLRTSAIGADGRLVDRLPAGRWTLLVRAARDAVEGPLAHARPWVGTVEVGEGDLSAVRLPITLELAGRLRFTPVAERDGARDVELELLAVDGRAVPLEIQSLLLRGDARQGRATSVNHVPFGANARSALIEPGTYTLYARIGDETWSRTITVVAGSTTVVEL